MKRKRGSMVVGFLLVLAGVAWIAHQYFPQYFQWLPRDWVWPYYIITVGGIFILVALLAGTGGLAVPGCIITTIGGILYYQTTTGDWESWSFIWLLIPASVGIGLIVSALIDKHWNALRVGFWLAVANLIVFSIFWLAFRGSQGILAKYWPVLLILAGIIFLIESWKPRRQIG